MFLINVKNSKSRRYYIFEDFFNKECTVFEKSNWKDLQIILAISQFHYLHPDYLFFSRQIIGTSSERTCISNQYYNYER